MRSIQQIIIISLFLLCLSGIQTASSHDTIEQLPDIFAPLTWEIDLKNLNKLFPKGKITETEYPTRTGKITKAIGIYNIRVKYFGEASVGIEHDDYKKIERIYIETLDTRPECSLDTENPIPKWCRNQYNQELTNLFKILRRQLSKKYGKSINLSLDSFDKREKQVAWERKGYDLILSITKGEQDDWAVNLTAIRK